MFSIRQYALMAITLLVVALRFTIPNLPVRLTSWPIWYMTLAHFWVGYLIITSLERLFLAWLNSLASGKFNWPEWLLLALAVFATVVEIGAFIYFR